MSISTELFKQKGFESRYLNWKQHVQKWADKHKISLESAASILGEYAPDEDLKYLISWHESGDFIAVLKEEID